MKYTKREFEKLLKDKLTSECNVTLDTASADQIYRCLASVTRQIMSDRQKQFQSKGPALWTGTASGGQT